MNDSLLIVAGGPLQVPAIEEARRLALRTVVVDRNPRAPGLTLADSPHVLDILDGPAVASVASRERVRGVMTLCTDLPVRTVACVGEALALPALSVDAALKATDKRRMRRAFERACAPAPRYREVQTLSDAERAAGALGYPVALKIAERSGSLGVYCVRSLPALRLRFAEARSLQPSGDLLVEQWIEGPEVSVEGLCFGRKAVVVQVTDKYLFPGPFPVEAGHSQPSLLPSGSVAALKDAALRGIEALGLCDCAFHAELRIGHDGPKLIEIGARLGGDRITTHLTPLSTGINLVREAVKVALGIAPDLAPSWSRASAIRYFSAGCSGTLGNIRGISEIRAMPGLELLFLASERDGPLVPGFRIPDIRSSHDRYGHVVFSARHPAEALRRADQAAAALRLQLASVILDRQLQTEALPLA